MASVIHTDYCPVMLGLTPYTQKLLVIWLRKGYNCCLVADHIPFSLRFFPRLYCVKARLTVPKAAEDFFEKLSDELENRMPCLTAGTQDAQTLLRQLRPSLTRDYLLFDTPEDLYRHLINSERRRNDGTQS